MFQRMPAACKTYGTVPRRDVRTQARWTSLQAKNLQTLLHPIGGQQRFTLDTPIERKLPGDEFRKRKHSKTGPIAEILRLVERMTFYAEFARYLWKDRVPGMTG